MNWNPSYIIGFEEPDCAAGSGSAGMDVATGAWACLSKQVLLLPARTRDVTDPCRCRPVEPIRRAQGPSRLGAHLAIDVQAGCREWLARAIPLTDLARLGHHQRPHQQELRGGYQPGPRACFADANDFYKGDRRPADV
jgi:hypothetical protein